MTEAMAQAQAQSTFDARAQTWDDDPMKLARAQSVAAAIGAGAAWRPGMRALEFGCGTGLLSFALHERFAELVLADTSPGMLEVLRAKIAASGAQHLRPLLLDEAGEALRGERFDMIHSLMTLHHVPDTAAILARFFDWLAPGGQLCIADLDAEDGSFHGGDPSVHHGFDRGQLARLAEAAGFRDVRFSTVFEIVKGEPAIRYPVFLMLAERGR